MLSCEIHFYKNIIFTSTEDCWAIAPDFQEQFERIIYFISNKTIQTQMTVWGFQKQLLAAIHSICSETIHR